MPVGTVEHVLSLSSRSHAPRCSSIALTIGLKTCVNGTHTHIGTAFVMLDDAEGTLILSDAFAPHRCWTLQFRRSRRELRHGLRVIRSVEAWKPMRKNSPRSKCQSDKCDRVREDRELGRLYYVVLLSRTQRKKIEPVACDLPPPLRGRLTPSHGVHASTCSDRSRIGST
jgi:hypothetical protein